MRCSLVFFKDYFLFDVFVELGEQLQDAPSKTELKESRAAIEEYKNMLKEAEEKLIELSTKVGYLQNLLSIAVFVDTKLNEN